MYAIKLKSRDPTKIRQLRSRNRDSFDIHLNLRIRCIPGEADHRRERRKGWMGWGIDKCNYMPWGREEKEIWPSPRFRCRCAWIFHSHPVSRPLIPRVFFVSTRSLAPELFPWKIKQNKEASDNSEQTPTNSVLILYQRNITEFHPLKSSHLFCHTKEKTPYKLLVV